MENFKYFHNKLINMVHVDIDSDSMNLLNLCTARLTIKNPSKKHSKKSTLETAIKDLYEKLGEENDRK